MAGIRKMEYLHEKGFSTGIVISIETLEEHRKKFDEYMYIPNDSFFDFDDDTKIMTLFSSNTSGNENIFTVIDYGSDIHIGRDVEKGDIVQLVFDDPAADGEIYGAEWAAVIKKNSYKKLDIDDNRSKKEKQQHEKADDYFVDDGEVRDLTNFEMLRREFNELVEVVNNNADILEFNKISNGPVDKMVTEQDMNEE